MEQRLVPSLTLIRSLKPACIVIEHLGRESIFIATFSCDFLRILNVCVTEDETQCRLGIPHQAVELVAEPLDVVH